MTEQQLTTLLTSFQAQNSLMRDWLNYLIKREERLAEREARLDAINAKRLARIEQHEDEERETLAVLRKMELQEYEYRAKERLIKETEAREETKILIPTKEVEQKLTKTATP